MNEKQLKRIASKPGFGLPKGWGVKPAFSHHGNPDTQSEVRAWSDGLKDYGSGEAKNLERVAGYESLLRQRAQIRSKEKVTIKLRFYRYRKADYSRAISEKALIDGIVSSGFVRDDCEDALLLEDEGQVKVDSREQERTEITIIYPDVDYDNLWEPRTFHGNLGIKRKT